MKGDVKNSHTKLAQAWVYDHLNKLASGHAPNTPPPKSPISRFHVKRPRVFFMFFSSSPSVSKFLLPFVCCLYTFCMYFLDNLLCGRPSWKPPKPPRSPVATTNGTMAISLSPHRPLSRHHTTTVDIGWKANIDYKAKLNLNKVFCKSSVVSRLQNLDDRSGEFCVCKLIVFTCEGQIGAIHTQIITKPVANLLRPTKISLDRAFTHVTLVSIGSPLVYS